MLESMRQKGASIFIYIIFGILIAAFVITLGPSNPDQAGGCGTSSNTVIEVDGNDVGRSAYLIAFARPFNALDSRDRVYFALETLIRREILAAAASERGIRVTGDMVDEEIKKGYFFLGGLRIPLGARIFDEHDDGTRTWNVRKFKNWVGGELNLQSTSTYRDEQIRSLQATLMYEQLAQSPRVSREEALNDFLFAKNTVSYDLVTFSPAPYKAAMRMTDTDVDRYLAAHEADVKARYQQDERLYKGLKPQLKLRQIFIQKLEEEKPEPAPEPAPGGGSAAGSAAGAAGSAGSAVAKTEPKKDEPKKDPAKKEPKIGMPIDEAKRKLEAARTDIEAGKLKFADAAKQLSTDEAAKASGGDLGWRGVDNPQMGDAKVNEEVKKLAPGKLTPVIETENGVLLVLAEDKREGDLDYEKVKREIASDLARDFYANEKAKREALAALEAARAGNGKNLSELFEKKPEPPGGGGGALELLNDPNIPDDLKRQLLEQLKNQVPAPGPSGSLVWESKDIPVKWQDAPQPGSAEKPAAGSAEKPAAGSAEKPAAGSAAGSGSAAPAPAPAPTPAGQSLPPIEATKDQLPQFGTVDKPRLEHESMQPRRSPLPGLAKELTDVVFDELSAGMLAKQVYEVNGSYVLFQITQKSQAKVEDFEKDAEQYIARLQSVRSLVAAEDWLAQRCESLHKDKEIVPAKQYVAETTEEGKPAPQVYQPCMFFGSKTIPMVLARVQPPTFEWMGIMLQVGAAQQ